MIFPMASNCNWRSIHDRECFTACLLRPHVPNTPLEVLMKDEGLRPLLFFYNPNIHPQVEWQRRRDNLHKLSVLRGLNVLVEADYAENEWVN